MASSSTSESDNLAVSSAVQSTKVLREPIQTMKIKKVLLRQCSCHYKIASYGPAHSERPPPASTFLDPLLSLARRHRLHGEKRFLASAESTVLI